MMTLSPLCDESYYEDIMSLLFFQSYIQLIDTVTVVLPNVTLLWFIVALSAYITTFILLIYYVLYPFDRSRPSNALNNL